MEKKGIPTVQIMFEDQVAQGRRIGLINGVPEIRFVYATRTGTGEQRITLIWDNLMKAITTPLTPKEKETGRYDPPPPPRVIYEGTLLDADKFFSQSQPVSNCGDCPIMKYTDGLPVRIPIESAVKEMLTGTSHSPDELIYRYSMNATTKQIQKGTTPVKMDKDQMIATVEAVAVNAVMAGCKPEYLPVALAIANTGVGTHTDVNGWQRLIVSGPIAKEIGMNAGTGEFNPGNPANSSLGRVYQLMAINLGGAITGVNRTSSHGHPGNTGTCIAENDAALPAGWLTYREEQGYKKTDSVIDHTVSGGSYMISDTMGIAGTYYRGFQAEGLAPALPQGSLALRLEKEGKGKFVGVQGPKNFLEIVIDNWWDDKWGPQTLVLCPVMANDLWGAGFKTKQAIYDYIWNKSFTTFDKRLLLGVRGVVGTTDGYTGKKWNDIPLDLLYPRASGWGGTSRAADNMVIVSGGPYEEWVRIDVGRGSTYPIDPWR
jgi:hypothetical protein